MKYSVAKTLGILTTVISTVTFFGMITWFACYKLQDWTDSVLSEFQKAAASQQRSGIDRKSKNFTGLDIFKSWTVIVMTLYLLFKFNLASVPAVSS